MERAPGPASSRRSRGRFVAGKRPLVRQHEWRPRRGAERHQPPLQAATQAGRPPPNPLPRSQALVLVPARPTRRTHSRSASACRTPYRRFYPPTLHAPLRVLGEAHRRGHGRHSARQDVTSGREKVSASGLEPLTCSLGVSGSYCTSNPLRSIFLVIGLSIGLFSRSRSALAENPFYRIPGSSGCRPRSLSSRWPASPSRACPKGSRGAFLPHGGDSKPRHCWCVWCTALLVVSGGPIEFFEQTGRFDGVPGAAQLPGGTLDQSPQAVDLTCPQLRSPIGASGFKVDGYAVGALDQRGTEPKPRFVGVCGPIRPSPPTPTRPAGWAARGYLPGPARRGGR